MSRRLIFAYGIFSYFVFFLSFLYAIGFVGNFWVPKTINSGNVEPLLPSLIINAILLSLFAIQHTIMARTRFKKWLTRSIPDALERSTFVLASSLLLFLLYAFWQPMPTIIWQVENAFLEMVILALFFLGWLTVFLSTFMINHFDLFGLRQVWLHLNAEPYTHIPFQETSLYQFVRHPIMLGFIIAFWATPIMTLGHLIFAIATTAYILIGIQFEESELLDLLGEDYADYREKVSMLIPKTRRNR
jgi:protein-S-isoprenylcysteine O-methyltransferase Ste14